VDAEAESSAARASGKPAPNKPAPGARPVRPTGTRRPTGKRNVGRR
jgi:preprotein translocase subunit SecF